MRGKSLITDNGCYLVAKTLRCLREGNDQVTGPDPGLLTLVSSIERLSTGEAKKPAASFRLFHMTLSASSTPYLRSNTYFAKSKTDEIRPVRHIPDYQTFTLEPDSSAIDTGITRKKTNILVQTRLIYYIIIYDSFIL